MTFKKIYIEITNICNKNCSFCSKDTKPKREMTVEEFRHVIKEIKPYSSYVYLHVKGEPLLHSNLEDILNICKEYNVFVNITTNGTLLKARKDILLRENTIRQINISLHSFKENEYINNIITTVNELKQKDNISIVYRFWALNNGKLSKDNYFILDQLNNYYHFTDKELKDIMNLDNIKLESNVYLNKGDLFTWPILNDTYQNNRGYCYGLKSHIGILSDGTVIPCCLDSDGIINLGNIFDEPLDQILNKKRTQNIIDGFKNRNAVEKLCQHCRFKERFKEK